MTSNERDYEDILRDALRAAAESVEPAVDGLERIRHRSHSRRSAGPTLARAAEWLRLHRIRLSVRLESLRWELSEEGSRQLPGVRSWPGRAVVLAGRVAAWLQPPAKPGPAGRGPGGGKRGQPGRASAWLRPVLAVGAVVVVVVGGVIALNRGVVATISPANNANNSITSARRHHHASGIAVPASQGPTVGAVPDPAVTGTASTGNVSAGPSASCPPSAADSGHPKPSSSRSASPTPSPTSSPSVTPTPTPTGSPSPSFTPSTGPGTGGTSTTPARTTAYLRTTDTAANGAAVPCGKTAAPTAKPKATATAS